MSTNTVQTITLFDQLGVSKSLLDILYRLKWVTPTPIQGQAIPIALSGKDVVGIAQTGTGKTLAFALPMLQRIGTVGGRGLVILPTRELALQVDETLHKLGRSLGLRTAVLIGGASMHKQIQDIHKKPHIIVATPGRLIDLLQQKVVKLDQTAVLVLDEADRMFDMGFAPQIKQIMDAVPTKRQTMLFSATMPPEIAKLAAKYMQLPLRIEVAPPGTVSERVEQEMILVRKDDKALMLEKLLTQYKRTVLVFTRTKHGAKKVTKVIQHMGHTAAEIHSNRSLSQRKAALEGFKSGRYRVLVATDIAARGIDVTNIELVVNYDLPDNPEDYVHRIGRTGRAGLKGHAISLATPDQKSDIRDIERVVRAEFAITAAPGVSLNELHHAPSQQQQHSRNAHGRRGGQRGGPARHGGRGGRSRGGYRHGS
jgi:ATP-dependent RNA helicase RhlE